VAEKIAPISIVSTAAMHTRRSLRVRSDGIGHVRRPSGMPLTAAISLHRLELALGARSRPLRPASLIAVDSGNEASGAAALEAEEHVPSAFPYAWRREPGPDETRLFAPHLGSTGGGTGGRAGLVCTSRPRASIAWT
jgi:hypothetical protein